MNIFNREEERRENKNGYIGECSRKKGGRSVDWQIKFEIKKKERGKKRPQDRRSALFILFYF